MSRHFRHLGLLLALVTLLVLPLVLSTGPFGRYRPGDLQTNLSRYLRTRHGLQVQPQEIVLPSPPHETAGLRPVGVYFLGRMPGEKRDLYFSHFVLSSKGIPVHGSPLFPLSRTKMADERELCLADNGRRFLAYASQVDGKTSAVTILELAGLPASALRGFTSRERLQQHLTNWQETGRWRGVGQIKVHLTAPQPVRLRWHAGRLEISNAKQSWKAVVDPLRAKVLQGPARAARVTTPRRNFVAWAVDTVRNFSFVGPDRIAWLEDLVFGVVDEARRMSGAKVTLSEIKDEMDLPVVRRRSSKIPGWPPPRLRPILRERLKGEGRWVEVEGPFLRSQPGMPSTLAATFIRPDRERLYCRVYFIAWDPRRVDLRMEAGLRNPTSATGLRGPGMIPRRPELLRRLVGAFNGGFQSTHGDFGMMVDGKVYAPAKPWAATVARLADGSTGFGTWDGQAAYGRHPGWIRSFRQNLTALVEDGRFNPWQRGSWGGGTGFFTGKGAKAHTWRSGLCLHKSGHVMYVLGNPVDGPTLGKTMQKVGCTYGMELDINVTHVGFEYIHALGPEEKDPPGAERFRNERYFAHRGAWPGVKGFRYLMRTAIRGTGNMPFPRWTGRADERELFYLVLREQLPGPDLPPGPGARQPQEGRWTSATLPEAGLAFPQAMSRSFLHPDRADPKLRVHLVQLDLRWLDTALCVPGTAADCLPKPAAGEPPLAVLPLGPFSPDRGLLADGKSLGPGGGSAMQALCLNILPLREGGPALPALSAQPSAEPGSISIQSAPEKQPQGRSGVVVASALCSRRGQVLLYASGIGVSRNHLETALAHAGCDREQVVHLGNAEPLVLVGSEGNTTVFGKLVPPLAASPSLIFRRSGSAWAQRIFTHVVPQPRRVWTMVQPEWTRNSVLRKSNRIAKALGLPRIKDVNDLCHPPYSDHPALRKLRWRDPITGEMCGKGFKPRVEIDASFKPLLKKRHTHGKLRGKPGTPESQTAPDRPRKKRRRRGRRRAKPIQPQ